MSRRRAALDVALTAACAEVGFHLITGAEGDLSVEGGLFGMLASAVVILGKMVMDSGKREKDGLVREGVSREEMRQEISWQVDLTRAIDELRETMAHQAKAFTLYVEASEAYRNGGRRAMDDVAHVKHLITDEVLPRLPPRPPRGG